MEKRYKIEYLLSSGKQINQYIETSDSESEIAINIGSHIKHSDDMKFETPLGTALLWTKNIIGIRVKKVEPTIVLDGTDQVEV